MRLPPLSKLHKSAPFLRDFLRYRRDARRRPERHVDVSSALWFVATASAICPIDHYDYRPPALALPDVTVGA